MATKIDHLGITVADLDASEKLFTSLLGVESSGREVVESEGVEVSFFQVGESLELLRATHAESPIQKALDKRGEGIHHMALSVDDIDAEVARLTEQGFRFVGEAPRPGAGGHRVAFVHPKSANGILVELSGH